MTATHSIRRPGARWRGLVAVVAVVVVTGVGLTAGAPAASAAVVDTSAWYVLVNRNSGKALDLYNLATDDGARISQWDRNDGAWQQWQFVDSGGGWYRLRSRHSGKVLDVLGYSTANGAELVQYTDHNGTNQQWQLIRIDGGGTGTPPGSYPNPGFVSGDIGVHDPSIVKRPEGGYIVAHTGNDISLKTSTDRITFRNAGVAFPGGAPWTSPYTNGSRNLWAPDISHHNGRYYLYYSASTFGSNRSAIFLATSPTGASGSWTNHGLVIESRTSDNFNAIDPNLLVDDQGRWWLSFGSFWSGIKLVQLDPATGRRLDGTIRSIAGRNGGAIEAPFIVKRGAWYYQYVSFDLCCRGASSTYRVMVGRSTNPTGPYTDRNGVPMTAGGGTQILAGHGGIHGPGHEAVLADTDGDLLIYHYYADNGAALLGINRIGYDAAGWPFVF